MGTENITKENLSRFYGTENYHKLPFFKTLLTDGVAYLMENGASWLVTDILSYQTHEKVKDMQFQVWTLKVKDQKGELTLREDTDEPIIIKQNYTYTDFPMGEIKLFVIDNVMLLTSEY